MTLATYLIGVATAIHREARTPSFTLAPDVWDRLVKELPEHMRDSAPKDMDTIGLHTPGGYVVVRQSKRVHAGCVEIWERHNTVRAPTP